MEIRLGWPEVTAGGLSLRCSCLQRFGELIEEPEPPLVEDSQGVNQFNSDLKHNCVSEGANQYLRVLSESEISVQQIVY